LGVVCLGVAVPVRFPREIVAALAAKLPPPGVHLVLVLLHLGLVVVAVVLELVLQQLVPLVLQQPALVLVLAVAHLHNRASDHGDIGDEANLIS
jgi:hypothetical protein